MEFVQRIAVAATPAKVWALLWDITRMATCIPGCQDAREIEAHKRYSAVVGERVGPFKVTFPLEIEVLEAVDGQRLRAAATGKDPAIGSSMKMALDLSIAEVDGQTVREPRDLQQIVASLPPGRTIPLGVLRDGRREILQVQVGEAPDEVQ